MAAPAPSAPGPRAESGVWGELGEGTEDPRLRVKHQLWEGGCWAQIFKVPRLGTAMATALKAKDTTALAGGHRASGSTGGPGAGPAACLKLLQVSGILAHF